MNYAIIPARKGSVGFKYKNRKFFSITADFLDQIPWFDKIIVSSDDNVIEEKAKKRKYLFHKRSAELSGPKIAIKSVMENVISEMDIKDNVYLWLFYLPVLYKNNKDYEHAKKIVNETNIDSICSFVMAKTHPYSCWKYDNNEKIIKQYIENDVCRRQDLPDAWMHYHYVCAFKAGIIKELNNELLFSRTLPIFLDNETSKNLIEIDTPEDYQRWKNLNNIKN